MHRNNKECLLITRRFGKLGRTRLQRRMSNINYAQQSAN